jgi:uncharacterized protein YeaO (DUF488 family)
MVVRVVKLGSPRVANEGLRIGTVRRPPRGVPKAEFATRDWYDVWLPNLAPSDETLRLAHRAKTPAQWQLFFREYRAEMARPENVHLLETLALLSQQTDFSVGCYCEDEAHCHRSALHELLRKKGARIA